MEADVACVVAFVLVPTKEYRFFVLHRATSVESGTELIALISRLEIIV